MIEPGSHTAPCIGGPMDGQKLPYTFQCKWCHGSGKTDVGLASEDHVPMPGEKMNCPICNGTGTDSVPTPDEYALVKDDVSLGRYDFSRAQHSTTWRRAHGDQWNWHPYIGGM